MLVANYITGRWNRKGVGREVPSTRILAEPIIGFTRRQRRAWTSLAIDRDGRRCSQITGSLLTRPWEPTSGVCSHIQPPRGRKRLDWPVIGMLASSLLGPRRQVAGLRQSTDDPTTGLWLSARLGHWARYRARRQEQSLEWGRRIRSAVVLVTGYLESDGDNGLEKKDGSDSALCPRVCLPVLHSRRFRCGL